MAVIKPKLPLSSLRRGLKQKSLRWKPKHNPAVHFKMDKQKNILLVPTRITRQKSTLDLQKVQETFRSCDLLASLLKEINIDLRAQFGGRKAFMSKCLLSELGKFLKEELKAEIEVLTGYLRYKDYAEIIVKLRFTGDDEEIREKLNSKREVFLCRLIINGIIIKQKFLSRGGVAVFILEGEIAEEYYESEDVRVSICGLEVAVSPPKWG